MASGPEVPNSSVWPSAAARATYSAPMLPPAPARFSTTMVWPSRSFIEAASVRALASVGPPGGKGPGDGRVGQGVRVGGEEGQGQRAGDEQGGAALHGGMSPVFYR